MSVKLNSGSLASFIICVTPFIDVINILIGIERSVSFGQIVRMTLLCLMHCVLLMEVPFHSLLIILLTVALALREALYSAFCNVSFMQAVVYDIYYIYVLSFFALLMRACKSGHIVKKDIWNFSKRFALITAFSVIIAKLLGVGLEYSSTGLQRLFGSANALTATLVWGASLWLYEAFYGERTPKSLFASLLIIYCASSQGTKAGLIGSFACIGLIFFHSFFIRFNPLKAAVLIGIGAIVAVTLYYYFTSGDGMMVLERWKYFIGRVDAHKKSVLSFVLSSRDEKLFRGMSFWIKDWAAPFIGFSFPYLDYQVHLIAPTSNYAATEMDIFDLFLFYGSFLGGGIALYLTRRALQCAIRVFRRQSDAYDAVLYIIFYILMFMGGHVLNSPFAGVAFCLSLALTDRSIRRENGNRRPARCV